MKALHPAFPGWPLLGARGASVYVLETREAHCPACLSKPIGSGRTPEMLLSKTLALRCTAGRLQTHRAAASTKAVAWRLTSAPGCVEAATESILTHGFVVLDGMLSPEALLALQTPLLDHSARVFDDLASKQIKLVVGSAKGFHEVVLRSPGRWDLPVQADLIPREVREACESICLQLLAPSDMQQPPATSASDEMTLAFRGMVRANPGCPQQHWHADSSHMVPQHTRPNLLNVLIPLADITLDDGPTELLPGSHVLTNHMRHDASFGTTTLLYQHKDNSPSTIGSTANPVSVPMPKGSLLIFDDRTLHRGGANRRSVDRDVAFLSYCRATHLPAIANYYEATRSLASYSHRALAEGVRDEFPGLAHAAAPVFADGAGGSQMHESAIAAMVRQMTHGVANVGGTYPTSELVGETVGNAREAMADLFNCLPHEVVFGPSMTALAFHLSRALRDSGRLQQGDNVVLDPISHGANVWPWERLAEATGVEVRWLPVASESAGVDPMECTLDARPGSLATVIDNRTKLVAVGAASNGVGSIHNVSAVCSAAREAGALSFIDSVHYAPHASLDVEAFGCDFLACSPYKFFGPHSGALFGRAELLRLMPVDKLAVADDGLPTESNCGMSRWEVGTQNFEALAGVAAAVDYIAALGQRFGGADATASRRQRLGAAWHAIGAHEDELKVKFLDGASSVSGLRVRLCPSRTVELSLHTACCLR